MVDDGSRDTTALVLRAWAMRAGFISIEFSRNFGKEAALTAGLEAAGGDVVVMIDANLQHPPELIEDFVRLWRAVPTWSMPSGSIDGTREPRSASAPGGSIDC